MKATLWLCSFVTTILCISQSVYGSPITEYRYSNSREFPGSYLSIKRTIPSLSIVNPVDVLRQRLILEMARRHMRETNAKIERNRQILKSVGKRGTDIDYYEFDRNLNQFGNSNNNIENNKNDLINSNNQNYVSGERLVGEKTSDVDRLQLSNLNVVPKMQETESLLYDPRSSRRHSAGGQLEAVTPISDFNNFNDIDLENMKSAMGGDSVAGDDDDYQTQYLYSLHKNLLAQ